MTDFELYKAKKLLESVGYLIEEQMPIKSRTYDVEELVANYKARVMPLIKQKIYKFLDAVFDDEMVPEIITIEIPRMAIKVAQRKDPIKMKALKINIYLSTKQIEKDYEQRGKYKWGKSGYGSIYAGAQGDSDPDYEPVVMMLNLPIICGLNTAGYGVAAKKTKNKSIKEATKHADHLSLWDDDDEFYYGAFNADDDDDDDWFANYTPGKSTETTKTSNTTSKSSSTGSSYTPYSSYGSYGSYGGYGGYSRSYYKPKPTYYAIHFDDVIEELGEEYDTPEEIINAIMDEYFGDWFQEVLTHELTHYVQANNKEIDGSENARDYDPKAVLSNGQYGVDEREFEAKLHQEMPEYIDKILRAFDITPVAKEIVNDLFDRKFSSLSKDIKQKYFNKILKLCQSVKSIPGITKHNYNTPKMRQALHNLI